jgi:GTPase SAR1 family protein
MKLGHIKKVFPGGNTSQGFYSFYHYILGSEARKLFILKGGPGVGKSTIIRQVAQVMFNKGYDLELHCCSSDNDALDGVVIPKLQVAIIDGTSPHVVEPKNPGVVDEIINLGDFWNEAQLYTNKEPIIQISGEVSRCFRRAYGYLAQARILNEEIESYYWDSLSLNVKELNKKTVNLIKEIFNNKQEEHGMSYERHLFASGITPKGFVNYLNTIFGQLKKRYVITGNEGTGKATILEKIYRTAICLGFNVEVYHCSLIPNKIEHLLIPELGIGVITSINAHYYEKAENDIILDTSSYLDFSALEKFKNDMKEASSRYVSALDRGIAYIARAKAAHDKLESYYVTSMNFEKIKVCKEQLIDRILNYA